MRHIGDAAGRIARAPVSTAANILTLALGFAAFIVAWGVVSYWRSSDSQFAKADRIQMLTQHAYIPGVVDTGVQPWMPRIAAPYLKEDFPELEAVARLRDVGLISADSGGRTTMLRGSEVDPEFLDVFDFRFLAGDPKTALKRESGLILTQPAAEKLFGREPALGRSVTLNKTREVVVTGVIAPIRQPSHFGEGAGHTAQFDYLSVYRPDPPAREHWLGNTVNTYIVLPADGSLTSQALNRRLEQFVQRRVPETQRQIATLTYGAIPIGQYQISRLNTSLFGNLAGRLSVDSILLGLGALVLAVACLNYASLATAQALTRARQIGMRKTLGASLGEILAQTWTEAALLALAPLGLAVLGVWAASPVIASQMEIDVWAGLAGQPLLAPLLAGLLILVALLAGAYPALVAARFRPVEALRAGNSRSGPKGVAHALVGLQFAMASILLIAVIVLNQQHTYLQHVSRRSGEDPVIAVDAVSPSKSGIESMRQLLAADPRIKGFGEMDHMPWSDFDNQAAFTRQPDSTSIEHFALSTVVGFGYFDVFKVKLLAGRTYDPERDQGVVSVVHRGDPPEPLSRPHPVIIDREFARIAGFASPQAAIGQLMYTGKSEASLYSRSTTFEIIGVVETQPLQIMGGSSDGGAVYLLDAVNLVGRIVIRIDREDVDGAIASIRSAWEKAAPGRPFSYAFADDLFRKDFEPFERIQQLFAVLSVMAFLISATGLFGMAVQVIHRRRHEIGVRKTLGSSVAGIVRLLLTDFSIPILIGNLLSWPLGYLAAQAYVSAFADRIDLTPAPFLFSLLITLAIAWAAVIGVVIKAAAARPADVLRRA